MRTEDGSHEGDLRENVESVVKQLRSELEAERRRNKGVETLSLCLEEERERRRKLSDQNKKHKQDIALLQNRLHSIGGNTSLSLEEGEFLRPDSSRALVDVLVTENAQLKRNQKYLNVDPAKFEKTLQENETLKKQLRSQHQNVQALQAKVDKAQKQLHSSGNEKDRQILLLEEQITELKHSKDTQSVLCNSLSDETISLRQQLKETMRKMQEQMKKLDDADNPPTDAQRHEEQYKQKILHLEALLEAEERRLKEVIDMNGRWQTYNKQREQYVQELKLKASGKSSVAVSDEEQQAFRKQIHQLEEKNQQLEEENRALRQQLAESETARKTFEEQIDHYKNQIQVNREDFRQEREDREREHSRAEKLEQELSETKAKLDRVEREQMYNFAERRQKSLENYEQQYYQKTYGAAATGRLRNIGVQQSAYVARQTPVRYACDDAAPQVQPGRTEDVVDSPSDDTLECPKCRKVFPVSQHDALLEHLDECENTP